MKYGIYQYKEGHGFNPATQVAVQPSKPEERFLLLSTYLIWIFRNIMSPPHIHQLSQILLFTFFQFLAFSFFLSTMVAKPPPAEFFWLSMVTATRPAVLPNTCLKLPEDYLRHRKVLPDSLTLSVVPLKMNWNEERRRNVPFSDWQTLFCEGSHSLLRSGWCLWVNSRLFQ